jgi:hypothetical protein
LISYLIFEKNIKPENILFFNIDILDLESKRRNIIDEIKESFLKLNNVE